MDTRLKTVSHCLNWLCKLLTLFISYAWQKLRKRKVKEHHINYSQFSIINTQQLIKQELMKDMNMASWILMKKN